MRCDHVKDLLKVEEEKLAAYRKTGTAFQFGRRPVSLDVLSKPKDTTVGGSNEFLPKQQRLTIGKPTLCRDRQMLSAYETMPPHLESDSLFCSENRSEFWWKKNTPLQQKELKMHVNPMDHKYMYRENVLKQAAALR